MFRKAPKPGWFYFFVVLFLVGCAGKHDMHKSQGMGHHDPGSPERAKIDWLDFETGSKKAREEGKLMIVDFHVHVGCHRCDIMEMRVFGNPEIAAKINKGFVPVRVDLDKRLHPGAKALGKKYDFNYDCLLVVCDAEGNAIEDDISGRMCFSEIVTPEWFLEYLDKAYLESDVAKDFFKDME